MSSSILYRRAPGSMVVCALLLSSLLFSGCSFVVKLFDEAENSSHRPAMVLLANEVTKDGTSVLIDIDEIAIGKVAFADLIGMAEAWRVNLSTWNGNIRVGPYAEYISTKQRTLTLQIPKDKMDKLLQADLDLKLKDTMNGADAKEVTKSFGVLVHKYPD